jgi:hypothetical protein
MAEHSGDHGGGGQSGPDVRAITLTLDEADWNAVQAEFARRQAFRDKQGNTLPDGDSNLAGAMVAEVVRDLDEYRSHYAKEHP